MTPTKPPAKAAQMIDNPPLVPGQRGWKLHRCPDGQQCRGDIGGGCARGWCEHFGIKPEDAAPPLQDAGVLREALEALEADALRMDHLEKHFHIDATGDKNVYATFVPMVDYYCHTLRSAIDAAMAAQEGQR